MAPDSILTVEKVEELTQGISEARQSLDKSREDMDEASGRVKELLEEQTKLKRNQQEHVGELKKLNDRLEEQAGKMQLISDGYTKTVNLLRGQVKTLAHDGGDERSAFMYRTADARGAVFSCRQEALELGMFLMATMKAENEAKQYARRWLQDHRADLRYLPNIPKSFVEHIASAQILDGEALERMNQEAYGKTIRQDLAGGAVPGSVFVRPEFINTLIRNVELHGAFRRNAMLWPMGSDTLYVPRRVSGITIYWEGEGEAASGADPNFELLGMTAKKMLMLHKFSSELGEDAAISIADIFMFEFALAIALEEDRIGFNGDGAGGVSPGFAGFVGVLGAAANATAATATSTGVPHLVTGGAGNDLSTEVTYAKLREMVGRLPTWAEENARWYLHRSFLADLSGVETTAGNLAVQYRQRNVAEILGYPVERVDQLPAASAIVASAHCMAIGDLRKGWTLGDRRKATVETSEHYSFNTDQLSIRLTARISFLMTQGNAMVVYKTGSA